MYHYSLMVWHVIPHFQHAIIFSANVLPAVIALSAPCLVQNPALQPCTQDVKLGFAHRAFQAEQ